MLEIIIIMVLKIVVINTSLGFKKKIPNKKKMDVSFAVINILNLKDWCTNTRFYYLEKKKYTATLISIQIRHTKTK